MAPASSPGRPLTRNRAPRRHKTVGFGTRGSARTTQNHTFQTKSEVLNGWQLNLLFFQDLAENEIRFRTTRKRPEENSESEFIELKLKNSNSIVNFMPTMITMFYCEQYPKVPPNGWSEDSWRKDTTERLHRDSLWHLEGWTTEVKDLRKDGVLHRSRSCGELRQIRGFRTTKIHRWLSQKTRADLSLNSANAASFMVQSSSSQNTM